MSNLVLGVFTDRAEAENAINTLENSGYNPSDISIVMKDSPESRTIVKDASEKVAEGSVSGAATGGVLGGLAGLLIGVGVLTIPGIGGLLIGGPIAAALGLTGAAALATEGVITGALAGGLLGGLVNLGLAPDVAREYEDRVKSGAILVAVSTAGARNAKAREILNDSGAEQVNVVPIER